MKRTVEEEHDLKYYLRKNRFFQLLISTRKYRDLLWSKEALFAFALSIFFTYILLLSSIDNSPIIFNPIEILSRSTIKVELLEATRTIITTISAGLFSLLGLAVAALALITGTIQDEVIKKIEDDQKLNYFISILFNFYFAGAVIGGALVLLLLTYFITYVNVNFYTLYVVLVFVNAYLVFFSIIYSIMLLGTCIRMLLTKYYILNKK